MLYTAHPELQTKKEHAAAAHHTRAQQPFAGHMATRREAAALALAATQQQETDTETAGSARGHTAMKRRLLVQQQQCHDEMPCPGLVELPGEGRIYY